MHEKVTLPQGQVQLYKELSCSFESFDLFPMEVRMNNSHFIYARQYRSHEESDSVFLYLHDLGDHIGRYDEFFHAFLNHHPVRCDILAMDFRGHGKSSGSRGHIPSFQVLCEDILTLLALHKERLKGKKLFIISSGLGSLVSLKLISDYYDRLDKKVDGLILQNPAFKWWWGLPQATEAIFQQISLFNKVRIPFKLEGQMICSDTVMAQEFDRDPLVNHAFTWKTFYELKMNSTALRTSAYYLDLPVKIMISRMDKLFDYRVTELFARAIRDGDVSYYESSSHDLIHSPESTKLIEDISQWALAL